jgi:hypothetical protein
MINCWGKDYTCNFRFIDGSTLPESVYDEHLKVADIFVSAQQYPWYVDILRNERPVHCRIDTHSPNRSYLLTLIEPVGEGEVVIRD